VQFRPVGVEGPGEEGAPEGAEFGERLSPANLPVAETEVEADVIVAMTRPVVFTAAFAASAPQGRTRNEFSPICLKRKFQL
jgi:hypothetical protein